MGSQQNLFSILIPTWNNLAFLKLCVASINKNSTYHHEILIHINDGSDGTLEWVQENGYKYTHSSENIGVCYALNGLRPLVTTDYVLFMNDDMYVCPEWDKALWNEISFNLVNSFVKVSLPLLTLVKALTRLMKSVC